MPTYVIEGKRIKTDKQLTDEDIDEIANSLKGSTPPITETKAEDTSTGSELLRQLGLTARAGVTGLTSLPAMVADAPSILVNAFTGRETMTPVSKSLQRGMTAVGIPEPKNDTEELAQAGASAMVTPASMSSILSKVGLTEAAKTFGANAVKQAVSSAGSGVGAEFGAQEARKEDLNPLQSFGYSLLYSLLGGGVGGKLAEGAKLANNKLANTKFGSQLLSEVGDKPVTAEDVKKVARSFYDKVDQSGVSVYRGKIVNSLDNIEATLPNYTPAMDTHRPVQLVLDRIRKDVIDNNSGPISFSKLDKYRQGLSDLVYESKDLATKRMAREALSKFDDFVGNLSQKDLSTGKTEIKGTLQDLAEARGAWRRVASGEKINELIEEARVKADASGGRLNFNDSVRSEFKRLLLDDKKMQGFSPDVKDQIKKLASSSRVEDLLSTVSRFDPRKPGWGSAVVLGTAASGTPAVGGSLAAAGLISEQVLSSLKTKAVKQLQQDILSGKVERPKSTEKMNSLIQSYLKQETDKKMKEEQSARKDMQFQPTSDTITLDGQVFPADKFGVITGRDQQPLPSSMFQLENQLYRATQ